jgi:hypothetical protein
MVYNIKGKHILRVFVIRVLMRIFGSKRGGVTGGRRKLHNERLHKLCYSRSIIRLIKPKRIRWTGNVAELGISDIYVIFLEL